MGAESGFANARQGIAMSAGSGSGEFGTVVVSNSGGITWGMSLSASSHVITVSVATGTGTGISSMSAGTTRITNGEVVLSDSNGVRFGIAGQTVTAQLPTVGFTQFGIPHIFGNTGQPLQSSQSNLVLMRVSFYMPMQVSRIDLPAFVNVDGGTAGTISMNAALYTMSGSTASLASSGSGIETWAATNFSAHNGGRYRTITFGAWSVSAGEYMLGLFTSGSGTGPVSTMQVLPDGNSLGIGAPAGETTFTFFDLAGRYTTGVSAFPASFQISDLNQSVQSYPFLLMMGGP